MSDATERRPPLEISSLQEARALEERVRTAAASACGALAELLRDVAPLDVLRATKFGRIGFDPLDPGQPLDLLDQVHRTLMVLTCIRGVEYLLDRHPGHAPFRLNLGAGPGPDVFSRDGQVVAEAFAAVTPLGNNKLRSDVERMRASPAPFRYVFYYAEHDRGAVVDPEVEIVAVEL